MRLVACQSDTTATRDILGQRTILERVTWPMEQFEQVEIILEVNQRRHLLGAESRVAAVDDGFEIGRGNLGGGDVEAEDLEGNVLVREVFPVLLWSVISPRVYFWSGADGDVRCQGEESFLLLSHVNNNNNTP